MNILMAFLPILLLVVVAFMLRSLFRYFRNNKNNFFVRKLNWFFGSYVALLVAAVILSLFIPQTERVVSKADFVEIAKKEVADFEETIFSGNIDKLDKELIKAQASFEWRGEVLKLQEVNNQYFQIPIVVEKKETGDGYIESYILTSKFYLQNAEISEHIRPFDMELIRDTLHIFSPEFEFNTISKEFPIRQFTKERLFYDHQDFLGSMTLYLRIPDGVRIETNDHFDLRYVN
ncbi:MAG: hypothetical protein ACI35R_00895 [Bacillus sp. (in: firmicutes)]